MLATQPAAEALMEMSEVERSEARALVRAPDLLGELDVAMGLCGLVGEGGNGMHLAQAQQAAGRHRATEHGADVRIIQQLLGHSKLETTQVYTEVSIKLLQDVHARTLPAIQAATDAASNLFL